MFLVIFSCFFLNLGVQLRHRSDLKTLGSVASEALQRTAAAETDAERADADAEIEVAEAVFTEAPETSFKF